MATILKDNAKLERVLRVYGIEKPVVVTLTARDITFRVANTKMSVCASWPTVIEKACETPINVPSYLAGRPLELLKRKASEAKQRNTKPA